MILNHGQRDKYLHEIIGLNSRLDTLQAVVLRHALKYLRDANEKRVEIARRYQEELREISEIELPPFPHNPLNIPNVFTIKVKPKLRQQLKNFLWEKGISTQIYYSLAMHGQKLINLAYAVAPGETNSLCFVLASLSFYGESRARSCNSRIK